MKRFKTFVVIFSITISSFAQTGINYKALIKGANGNVVANDVIQIQFSILQGATTVYQESHNPTTDTNGIAIVNIGLGTPISGTFSGIEWNADDHFLNVQVDTGSGLVDLGTTQFMSVPYALYADKASEAQNVSGLEQITENGNIGWRLVGADPANYGDIGDNAKDLSISTDISSINGATGDFSVALGLNSKASGFRSTAFGGGTEASGLGATAFGNSTTASGNRSVAFGSFVVASGDNSFATGEITEASGFISTSMGSFTEAKGDLSTTMGLRTKADAYNSLAIGRYNIGGGNLTIWNGADPLFEVGNGTSDSERNNALTIYKNGRHEINSNSIGMIIRPGSGSDGLRIEPQTDGQIADGIEIGTVTDDGIRIVNAWDVGINVVDSGLGGVLRGDFVGLLAEATNDANPDIILGGNGDSSSGDDGIISSELSLPSSDIILRSNDNVFVDLDEGNNNATTSSFRVRNGANSALFEIDDTGDVGIGTTTPDTKLHIVGGSDAEYTDGSGYFVIGSVNSTNIVMDNNEIMARSNNASSTLFLQQNGGNVAVNGAVVHTSDRRLKKDIKALHYGLNEILALNPVAYKWKDKPKQEYNSIGLIAQELQKVISELVTEENNDEKTLHVNYTELIPVLINAIKEQQNIIDNQSQQIQQYKGDFKLVFERLEALEKQPSN